MSSAQNQWLERWEINFLALIILTLGENLFHPPCQKSVRKCLSKTNSISNSDALQAFWSSEDDRVNSSLGPDGFLFFSFCSCIPKKNLKVRGRIRSGKCCLFELGKHFSTYINLFITFKIVFLFKSLWSWSYNVTQRLTSC